MEGLIKRAWIMGGLAIACGAAIAFCPPPRSKPIDETWMAQHAPGAVEGYQFEPSTGDPGCSYKMSDSTYKTLQPSGILARLYKSGDKTYDVVLIASDNSVSFHDPRVCFTASGWTVKHQQEAKLQTQSRGDVPATLVEMEQGSQKNKALYLYRSPFGYESVALKMRAKMFLGDLMHGRNDQGVFYRFIPVSGNITNDDLRQFAAQYLDAANHVSGGFF